MIYKAPASAQPAAAAGVSSAAGASEEGTVVGQDDEAGALTSVV